MKKLYPKLLIFLLPVLAQAQLYVQQNTSAGSSNNIYIYNKGEVLFVNQDINLKDGDPNITSGNIYLRDQGQLIQGDDASANDGTGIVSVYQTGHVNRWDYHFWALPVSDPLETNVPSNGNKGNRASNLEGTATDNEGKGGGIFSPTGSLASDPASYTRVNGEQIGSGTIHIANYWLNKYVNSNGYSSWTPIEQTGDLNPGEGFTMKGINGGTGTNIVYDFRGRPNNGLIKVEVGNGQNTLVGNPYPSAMDLSFFLLSNSTTAGTPLENCKAGATAVGNRITGIAYFWESNPGVQSHYLKDYEGGYGSYSAMECGVEGVYVMPTYSKFEEDGTVKGSGGMEGSDENNPTGGREFAPVGQGFFVEGSDQLSEEENIKSYVEFHNEFRVFQKENETTSTFRKAEKKQKLSLKHQNFNPETGKLITPQLRITTTIDDTYDRELVTVFYDGATTGYDRAKDGHNISFLETDVSYLVNGDDRPFNIDVLPYDKDLKLPLTISAGKKANKYVMQVSNVNYEAEGVWLWDKETDEYHDILSTSYSFSLPEGEYNDRFAIVFKDKEESLSIKEKDIKNSFDVFQNNKAGQLEVINPKNVELREIAVFDILGKQVVGKLNMRDERKTVISSRNWSSGIYVVRVVTMDNVEFSKKISVVNK